MKEKAIGLLKKMGVNRAIYYFLLGKGFSAIAGPVTLYLIATFFSPTVQGYYYTMASFLALSIFFELGLGVVITQFASHEYGGLKWGGQNLLEGDAGSLSRIVSLSRKSLKWYSIITAIFIIIMIPLGLWVLGSPSESLGINYLLPWVFTVIFFALGTAIIPLTSLLEGCGRVAEVAKMRVIQSVTRTFLVWGVIVIGGKLYVISTEFFITWAVFIGWMLWNYYGLVKQIMLYKVDPLHQVSWSKEVFPMQWRVATSWVAAYFTCYLFIPLLFAFRGPIEAGKMGMSLRLSELIFLISMAWINTRTPYYGALVKQKKYAELDRSTAVSTLQALLVGLAMTTALVLLITALNLYFPNYGSRVLSPLVVGVLCLASLANVFMSSLGGYLRAHKQEPFMPVMIAMAVLVASISFFSARFYDANVMSFSYAGVLFLFGIPYSLYIFFRKRSEWHEAVDLPADL